MQKTRCSSTSGTRELDATIFVWITRRIGGAGDPTYMQMFKLFFASIVRYSTPLFDINIHVDESLYDDLMQALLELNVSNRYAVYVSTFKFTSPVDAQKERLRMLDILGATHPNTRYARILYMDIVILALCDLQKTFFEAKLADDTLYAVRERFDIADHRLDTFSILPCTDQELMMFDVHRIYPFNSGVLLFADTDAMRKHWKIVQALRNTSMFDQAILNHYFNRGLNGSKVDTWNIINAQNTVLYHDRGIDSLWLFPGHVVHFYGQCASLHYSRADLMRAYLNAVALIHPGRMTPPELHATQKDQTA